MDLLHLNLYVVTRHYGGSEEGGWWYDTGEPLASIPFEAVRVPGCGQCPEGECQCLNYPDDWDDRVQQKMHEAYCDYSPCTEEEAIAKLEKSLGVVYRLEPKCPEEVTQWRDKLAHLYADSAYGNIGSVNGGAELQTMLEDEPGAYWPSERPRYE